MFIYRIADILRKHKVSYAIVGGFAVALHGAVRGTMDLDLVIKTTKKDFVALEKALLSIGMTPRLPVKAEQIFDYREEYIKNRNLIAWSFYNEKSPAEIVDIIITHDLRKMKIDKLKVHGKILCVLAIGDLIKMKNDSGRPQDLLDIEALEKLK